jgi:hypothetical protein
MAEIVAALEASRPEGPTDLREVASLFIEQTRRRGMLVLFSDLFDFDAGVLPSLKMVAARGHQVVVFHVLDGDELDFPFEDATLFESMEDERRLLAFPREIRLAYRQELQRFCDQNRRALAGGGLAYEPVRTDEPPHQPLLRHLTKRQRRKRRPA